MGRFTSPDPVVMTEGRLSDPQLFNLYAYSRSNPLRFIDPTGLDPVPVPCNSPTSGNCYSTEQAEGERRYEATISAVTRPRARGPLDKAIGAAKKSLSDAIEVMSLGNPTETAHDLIRWLRPSTDDEAVGAAAVSLYYLATLPESFTGLKKQLASARQFAQVLFGKGAVTIAGEDLRVAKSLASEYGGSAEEWVKVRSASYTAPDGHVFEIHAYQNVKTGQVVEPKTIWNARQPEVSRIGLK